MHDINSLLLSLFSLIGIIVGASLQFFFNKASETNKQFSMLKNTAYVDYLRSVAKSAHALSPQDLWASQAEAADAKTRIAIYGDALVIAALAKYEEAGTKLNNENSQDKFLDIVCAMRMQRRLSKKDFSVILMGAKNVEK